jgi:SurA-like protein
LAVRPIRVPLLVLTAVMLVTGCSNTFVPAAAIVDGVRISQDALQARYERNLALADPTAAAQITAPGAAVQRADFTRQVLSSLILEQVIERYAKDHHIKVTASEINTELNAEIAQLGQAQFQRELKRRGVEVADVRDSIRGFLLQNKVRDDITKGLPVGAPAEQVNQFLNQWLERRLTNADIEVNPRFGKFDPKSAAVCRVVSTAGDIAATCGQTA